MVDSALAGLRKPDPAIWLHAIERAGGSPEQTVIVGDSYRNDIAPALAIGARAVWYRGLEWRPSDDAPPGVHEVRSVNELRDVLLRLAGEISSERVVADEPDIRRSESR